MLNKFRSQKIGVAGYRSSAFIDYNDGYLSWMLSDGYSKATLHGYLEHIRAFAAFFKRKRITPTDLNEHHVPEFLNVRPSNRKSKKKNLKETSKSNLTLPNPT